VTQAKGERVVEFTWASALGAGVALFLLGGAVHLLIGVFTPFFADSDVGRRILFLSTRTDAALFGGDPSVMLAADPVLARLRFTLMLAVGGLLVALGIAELSLAWFGVRAGQTWALWALTLSGLAVLPIWYMLLRPYLAAGPVGLGDLPPFMWIPTVTFIPAIALSWIGIR
jgi:hypothetical protein